MAQEFTVSLQAIIDECKLEVIHTPQDPAKIFISNIDVNRPGLQLAGFYEYFDKGRIQIIGKAETAYLEQCGAEIRAQRIKKFFSEQPAAVAFSLRPESHVTVFLSRYTAKVCLFSARAE